MKNSYMKNFLLFAFSVALNFIFVACARFEIGNKTTESTDSTAAVYEADVLVSTLAGDGNEGSVDGLGMAAKFSYPEGIAVDKAGNVYIADKGNHHIRKTDSKGNTRTLAGSGILGFGGGGFADGPGTVAKFYWPEGIAVDSAGNVYVADKGNHRIRKIDSRGNVSTLAGSQYGFADGQRMAAKFYEPRGVAVDSTGIVFVTDTENHRIRKIDNRGRVSTLAGDGSAGFADGRGTSAFFNGPLGIAVDKAGNIYVADIGNHRIRKIDSNGMVYTLAGSGPSDHQGGGFADGPGTATKFCWPYDVAVDKAGNVYVADTSNNRIRKIDSKGNVSTLAGNGTDGFIDGQGTVAQFSAPKGIVLDSAGNLYVADTNNHRIRKITQVSSTKANGD